MGLLQREHWICRERLAQKPHSAVNSFSNKGHVPHFGWVKVTGLRPQRFHCARFRTIQVIQIKLEPKD